MKLNDASDDGQHTRLGIVGTFDVENYGDLLFPMIAAEALGRRNSKVDLLPFSPNARDAAAWPYQIRSTQTLPELMPHLAALLVGGGQIVRFDDAYPVPVAPGVKIPLEYWLLPALQAGLHAKPVFWNGIGAWTDSPRAPGLDKLVEQVFAAARFVGVRDAASREHLAKIAPSAPTEFLPDTAFSLARLWPLGSESDEFVRWRGTLGIDGSYVVVQSNPAIRLQGKVIQRQMRALGICNAVMLPICWCHGDRAHWAPRLEGKVHMSDEWLHPHLIREIIARSDFLFASSLHACITAISYGVPVARGVQINERTFELLDAFESVARMSDRGGLVRLAQRGRRVEPLAIDYADRLERYWDHVSEVVSGVGMGAADDDEARVRALKLIADLCQQLLRGTPGSSLRERAMEPIRYVRRHRANFGNRLLSLRQKAARRLGTLMPRGVAKAGAAPDAIEGSSTQPSGPVLRIEAIESAAVAEQPYRWAFIDGIFSAEDAARLAREFPHDSFRKVAGNDGEKSYKYLSRSLVHMGAEVPTNAERLSPAWRALIADLLSDRYRDAISRATGLDLSEAPIEINAIHFGAGAWLGPHVDLKDKIATHILYFNQDWHSARGGCLQVLRSQSDDDVEAEILPIVGNSALLVRSDKSWHAVSPVAPGCMQSRRNINVIFHLPGSVSTMWPPGEKFRLHDFADL